jgi:hypothetical protein
VLFHLTDANDALGELIADTTAKPDEYGAACQARIVRGEYSFAYA